MSLFLNFFCLPLMRPFYFSKLYHGSQILEQCGIVNRYIAYFATQET